MNILPQNLKLRDEAWEEVFRMIEPALDVPMAQVNELAECVENPELGQNISEAVSNALAIAVESAFAAGWQCAREPERLIFHQSNSSNS